MSEEKAKITRRSYMKYVGGVVAVAVVAAAGYGIYEATKPTPTPMYTVNICTWFGGGLFTALIKEGVKQPLLLEFEKDKNVTVALADFTEDVVREKSLLDATSHTGTYDLWQSGGEIVAQYAVPKYLYPIDDYMKNYTDPKYLDLSDVYPKALEGLKYDGVSYGLPIYYTGPGITYRKDLFEEAGWDRPPNTMEELEEIAKALTKPPNQYGLTTRCKAGEEPGIDVGGFAWAYGGTWFEGGAKTATEIKANKAKPAFNTSEFLEGFKMFCDLSRKYGPPDTPNYTWYEQAEAYKSGLAAMVLPGNWCYWYLVQSATDETIKKNTRFAVPPPGPVRETQNFWSSSLFMNADSKNKRAAWEVQQLCAGKKMQETMAASGNTAVTIRSLHRSGPLTELYPKEDLANIEKAMDIADWAYRPYFPEFPEVEILLGNATSAVVAGRDAKTALDEVQDKAYSLMKAHGYYD